MALQTTTTIKIGEKIIENFTNLEIIQKIHDHHTFSFQIRKDLLVDEFKSFMPLSQQLSGEKISIEIKPAQDLDDPLIIASPEDYLMQFYGIISGASFLLSSSNNIEETILIKGYSVSIILDGGPESNSFTQLALTDIVNKVKAGYEIDMNIMPYYKDNLSYTVQYNESDFVFLNRLAMRYGQWFYYNGRIMVFGSPGTTGNEPKLVYGVNMQDFRYDIKLAPTLLKVIENDNRKGDYSIDNIILYSKELDGFHQNFIKRSNAVFNKETTIQLNQNAVGGSGRNTVEEYAKNKMRSNMSGMLQIEASSDVPGITLGNVVQISGVDVQLDSRYRVIEITHTCDDSGGYENRFSAVNYNGSVFSPNTNPDLVPNCQSQSAIVIDNADPDGLSAVIVQMPWQKIKGVTTPYIPMLQRYGGEGKGSHVLPEIGETVLVEFQGNNAEMPFVIGTLPNLKEKSGYATPDNNIKAIRTRSGIETLSNDAEGSWKQSTPDGNFLVFDGKGNAVLNIPNKLTVNATNIEFNSFNNLEMNVSNTMILNIMSRFFVFTPFMKQIVSGFMSLFSGKALINSKESINIEAEEVTAFGTKKMLVHSDKLTTVNSMEVAEMHGATKNNFTNKPIAQSRNPFEKITNVMVEFRTIQTSYNGEFGFDWLRIDDNGATIEKPYYDCLENGYEQPNGRDLNTEYESKDEAFEHLEKEYLQIAIDRTSTPNLKKYYIPWLNLFPEAVSIACTTLPKPCCEAELRILVDVEIEEPDQIRIVFDKRYFTIDGSDGTDATPVLITDKVPGPKRDIGNTITIKCIDEFASRQEITVYAYPKDSLLKTPAEQLTLRQVAGKIVLEPNKNTMASRGKPAVKNRKELKIILVQLRTNVLSAARSQVGIINLPERENLCLALHQSLIHGELIDYTNSFGIFELNLTNNVNFKMGGKYIDSSNGLILRTEATLNSYLRQLVDQSTANRYVGSFYVFVFGIQDSTQRVGGRVEGIGKKSVVLYKGRDNFTLNHEVLHGLGLWHTHWDFSNFVCINRTDPNVATIFDNANPPVANSNALKNQMGTLYTCPNGDTWYYGTGKSSSAADQIVKYRVYEHPSKQEYIFKHADRDPIHATDNIMTYQPDGKTTWHWQWKIIKKNI